MKKILFVLTLILLLGCSRDSDTKDEPQTNLTGIDLQFSNWNIKWNQSYTWKEYKMHGSSTTPYSATGKEGQITFIKPNIIKESYNGSTYQTTFSSGNFSTNNCDLLTPDWHNKPNFPFINNVSGVYKQNNEIVWSYCYVSGGVYDCVKLSFIP